MPFCSACTHDIAAAKKNTKSNGWVEAYREQSKADDSFVFTILQFLQQSQRILSIYMVQCRVSILGNTNMV